MLPNRPSLERVASRQKRYGVRTSRPSSIYTRSNFTAATTSSPSHIRTVERTSAPSLEQTDVSTLESRLLDAEMRKTLAKYTECDTKNRVDGPRLGVTITCGKTRTRNQSGWDATYRSWCTLFSLLAGRRILQFQGVETLLVILSKGINLIDLRCHICRRSWRR